MINPNILKNRQNLTIAGAVVLTIVIAVGVIMVLKAVGPNDKGLSAEEQAAVTSPATKEEMVIKADTAFKAGEKALSTGKTDEAITQLTEAKKLYQDAGETTKVEQTSDVISNAEYEARIEKEQGTQPPASGGTQGGESTSGSEGQPTGGGGSAGSGETTITSDKATHTP